ncbi:MAG: hypothetical protein JST82_03155 [Bacteroidetes bacterium]|nr:hypothetical protein [Bacteroidota bacterium]
MVRNSRWLLKTCLLIVSVYFIVASACNKPEEAPTPYYGNDYGDLKYTIDGVKDMSMERIGQGNMSLFVNRSSGKIENVMLTVVGLPQGASALFSPGNSALPSYNTVLTIKCNRVKEGSYDLILRGASQTTGFTDYKFKLNVLPYSDASLGLVGLFKESGLCTQSGAHGDTVNIQSIPSVKNRINIQGFWNGVWANEIYADLNVANNSLNIPAQSVNGVTIIGSGTYDDNTLIVNYRVAGSTVNDTCAATLSRL